MPISYVVIQLRHFRLDSKFTLLKLKILLYWDVVMLPHIYYEIRFDTKALLADIV